VVELEATGVDIKRLILEGSVVKLERQHGLDNQDPKQNGSTNPCASA
jgi:hypothetical protein